MKKIILISLLVFCFLFVSCETASTDSGCTTLVNPVGAPYVDLYYGIDYRIVYSSVNGVIYHVSDSIKNSGNLCPLYNPDGSLMVYPSDWSLSDAD